MIESNGFPVTSKEIASLMDRYDKNADGVITYQEFSDEIRPHSPMKHRYWVEIMDKLISFNLR